MAEAEAPPRLVVLGCGFGGYSLLSRLSPRGWQVTLVSPRNYFLFTPLLPSAVTGTVELRSILEPARRRLRGIQVIEGEALEVRWAERQVVCRSALSDEELTLPYDYLVIAVGAAVADYGIPGVLECSLPLTSVEDARTIRRRILEQFAKADLPGLDPAEIRRRLTFVICGAGPTGVEVAAEIDDLLDRELQSTYPRLASSTRILLLEGTSRILQGFDEALSEYAQRHFQREGIDLRLEAMVEAVEPGRVILRGGEVIDCELVVWAGGNAPVKLVRSLGEPLGPGNRLRVDERLRLPGREGVFALGDCAVGEPPLPATAQVAQQQGKYLAKALTRLRRGREVAPFRFNRGGMLAYIGGGQALADLPQVKWSGRTAWLFWRSVYLTKLVSLANKTKVLFDWVKSRLFGRDLSRF